MRTRVPIGSGPWTRPAGSYRCSGGDSGSGPFVLYGLPSVWAVSNRSDRPGSEVEAISGGYRGWAVRPDREPDPPELEPDPLDPVPRLLIDPPPELDPAPE